MIPHTAHSDVTQRDFIYEFTTDKTVLKHYYRIREDSYKKGWGLAVFSGAEDEHDRRGDILVVRDGDNVIGGGRVVFRTSHSTLRLPMETDDFLFHNLIADIGSGKYVIGELGRVAMLDSYRGGNIAKIGLYLLAKAQQHNCRYLTTVAPERQAIKYKKIAKELGIDIIIHDDIPVADHPYYNDIEMKLLVCDITLLPDCRDLLTTNKGEK